MAKNKKELEKTLNNLISDILDNYDKYSDEDKKKVENQVEQLISLNTLLDKYDKKKQGFFEKLKNAFKNFFGCK